MSVNDIDVQRARHLLDRIAEGDVLSAEEDAFLARLSTAHPVLQHERQIAEATRAAMLALADEPVPEDLGERIMTKIARQKRGTGFLRSGGFKLSAVAAAMVLLMAVGILSTQPTTSQKPMLSQEPGLTNEVVAYVKQSAAAQTPAVDDDDLSLDERLYYADPISDLVGF